MPFASSFELLVTRPAILTLSPLWALVPATLAFALYAWFRTPRLIGAAALWVAYMLFEFAMRGRTALGRSVRSSETATFGIRQSSPLGMAAARSSSFWIAHRGPIFPFSRTPTFEH